MTVPVWIHGSNDRADDESDVRNWIDMNPGGLILLDPKKEFIEYVRSAFGWHIPILGRFYGQPSGPSAWSLPYMEHAPMREYGRWCGIEATRIGLTAVQWANEPTHEWAYWDKFAPDSLEGYQAVANGSAAWLEGFRSTGSKAFACTVPLSPGRREDDYGLEDGSIVWGYRGADVLKGPESGFDWKLFHNYWTCDPGSILSSYWGLRSDRQLEAHGWTKPYLITESNRDPACFTRDDEAAEFRLLVTSLNNPLCLGIAYFIWDSNDPDFSKLRLKHKPKIIAVTRELNATREEPTMPPLTPTKLALASEPILYAGHNNKVVIEASGVDDGGFMLRVRMPMRPNGNTYEDDPFTNGSMGNNPVPENGNVLRNGRNIITVPVRPFDAPDIVRAKMWIEVFEATAGSPFQTAQALDVAVDIVPSNIAATPTPEPPPQPGVGALPLEYDPIFTLAGDMSKYSAWDYEIAIRIHKLVQWRKGELTEDPFPKAR